MDAVEEENGIPAESSAGIGASLDEFSDDVGMQDGPARALTLQRTSVREVLAPANLDAAWRRVLKRLRVTRFPDLVMLRDPLDWAAAQWTWELHKAGLASSVFNHRYRPQPAEELRAAKSKGLSRAMSYLSLDDQILYTALVLHTKSQLLALTEPWTRSGRQDGDDAPMDEADDSDSDYPGVTRSWFERWLATQRTISKILDECELIVETDISNFFPSVQLEVLRNRLAVSSCLDHSGVELLTYIASEVGPPRKLQRAVTTGLPVEDHDCSRTLAHFLLAEVDEFFSKEGEAGHYARFVDDIAFGADSEADAKRKLGRFQDALDRVGLYPNNAKTRWFTREQYEREYHRAENDQLGDIEELMADGDNDGAQQLLAAFIPELLADDDRRRGWDRVLRRACTISRKCRSTTLLRTLPLLLWDYPSAARHLLEYRSSFTLTDEETIDLFSTYSMRQGIYEDIDALVFEYLAVAPVASAARPLVLAVSTKQLKSEFSARPIVAAAATICLAKHSSATQLGGISAWAESVVPAAPDSVALRTLVTTLAARRQDRSLARHAVRRSAGLHRCIEFLDGLADGDEGAVRIGKSLLAMSEKKDPDRLIARSRGLLLLPTMTSLGESHWRQLSDNERRRYSTRRADFPDRSLEERWEWAFD